MRITAIFAALPIVIAAAPARADAKKPVVIEPDRDNSPDGEAIPANEIKAAASTTLCEKKPKLCHGPEAMLDGEPGTAWCEGLPGDGKGAVLTFTLAKAEKLTGIYVMPHFGKNMSLAEKNARLATIEITTDGGTFTSELEDLVPEVRHRNPVKAITRDCGDESCMSRDSRIASIGQYLAFPAAVTTTKVVITVQGTYAGTRYQDTCASDLTIYRTVIDPAAAQ